MTTSASFQVSLDPEPHRERARAILQLHPEIRQLFGHDPRTMLFIMGLLGLQLGLAALLAGEPWWLGFLVGYAFGALIQHALFVLMHECNHGLIFHKRAANRLAGIVANLLAIVPSSDSFQRYHLKHHAFQGVHELDADMPSYWEARLVGNSTIGKALWLLGFPVFLALRPAHLREIALFTRWTVANIVAVLAANVLIWVFLGPMAFLYLIFSLFFSLGLHPVGARWISEHYLVNPPQETYSYYGPLNAVAFNIGYHNEHHDFPAVPWNRIRRVRALAPEWYDTLVFHVSWSGLLWRFVTDPALSLTCRLARSDRGGKALIGTLR